MTQLTYRGNQYYKEDQLRLLVLIDRHRPQLTLKYRIFLSSVPDWWSDSFAILILHLFV